MEVVSSGMILLPDPLTECFDEDETNYKSDVFATQHIQKALPPTQNEGISNGENGVYFFSTVPETPSIHMKIVHN